jgi:guanylate kinase
MSAARQAGGLLFVITAPSGAGKSSLINALLKRDPALRLSVSYTTRAPRPGEQDGREYHFVDEPTFLAMEGRGEFLESAQVHGNRYGTAKKVVEDSLARGEDLVLEIDWQGARRVRTLHPACVGIFILPPSFDDLAQRMRKRGQDSEAVIQRRLDNAREELTHQGEFKYAIINKDFETAVGELTEIVQKERASHGAHHR